MKPNNSPFSPSDLSDLQVRLPQERTIGSRSDLLRMVIFVFAFIVLIQTACDILFASNHIGGDFSVRYNEVECLKSGVNPFDVWSGKIRHETYYSFHGTPEAGQTKMVHAYPPWEYTFFLPLSVFSRETASHIFFALEIASLLLVVRALFRFGKNLRGSVSDALFITAAGFFLGGSLQNAFWFQQFGIVNLALIVLMINALDNRHDILAGLCWSLLMSKPQVGLLFCIPLLLGKRYKMVATAVAICCLASIPPALLCRTSPVGLILSLARSGGDVLHSTSIVPRPAFVFLADHIHPAFPGLLSAILALSFCCWFSWKFKSAGTWLFKLMPSIVCATAWTYLQLHDKTLFLFPQAVAAACIVLAGKKRFCVIPFALLSLSASSYGAYFHAKTSSWMHLLGWSSSSDFISRIWYGIYILGSAFQFAFGLFLLDLLSHRPSLVQDITQSFLGIRRTMSVPSVHDHQNLRHTASAKRKGTNRSSPPVSPL